MSAHSKSEAERAQLEKAVEAGKQQCREAYERLSEAERAQLEKVARAGMEAVRARFEAYKMTEAGKQQCREAIERGKAELAAKLQAEVERQRPKPEKLRHDGKPA